MPTLMYLALICLVPEAEKNKEIIDFLIHFISIWRPKQLIYRNIYFVEKSCRLYARNKSRARCKRNKWIYV